jgi:ABC-2 type transport system permease protein
MTIDRPIKVKAQSGTWLRGFKPIYDKEVARWFGTKRWIAQLCLWLMLAALPSITAPPPVNLDRGVSILSLFFYLGSTPMAIGTIVLAQGTIIEEKLTQTLLWVCSKPLSRTALVLGKFAAYATFIGTIVLGAPALVVYITALGSGGLSKISIFNYLASVATIEILLLFLLSLTLMLGTMFRQIGAVTAIAICIFFAGSGSTSYDWTKQIAPYTFWALQSHASTIVVGQFSVATGVAILTTILLTLLCLGIAAWQMEQCEL